MQPVISGLKALLAPRNTPCTIVPHQKILCSNSIRARDQLTVRGCLLYEDDQLPDSGRVLQAFMRGLLGDRYKGSTVTDKNGNFNIRFSKPRFFTNDILFKVMDDIRPFARKHPFGAQSVPVDEILVKIPRHFPYNIVDIGTQNLTFANTSKELNVVDKPLRSHMPSFDFFRRLNKAAFPELPKVVFITLFKNWLTTEQVQRICDAFGPTFPKQDLTTENLIDALLNQICAVNYEETAIGAVWETAWPHSELKFQGSLADVRVEGRFDGNRNLCVESITLRFGKDEPIIIKPKDAMIPWAVYVARSQFVLAGEIQKHLMVHTLDGIKSDSFYKYIKSDNPLFDLLDPIMGETRWINYLAFHGAISGPGSPIGESALTDESFYEILRKSVEENADYRKGQPKPPLNDQHHFAIAGNQNYQDLLSFFTRFIEENRKGIHATWYQNFRWSESMHKRLNAITKFTEVEENPTVKDEQELAKALVVAVFMQTFFHYAIHSRQTLLTDVRGASLGIRDRALDAKGNFNPYGNTTPASAVLGIIIARILLSFEAESFSDNPRIHPELRRIFNASIDAGKYPGYPDAKKTHSTLKI